MHSVIISINYPSTFRPQLQPCTLISYVPLTIFMDLLLPVCVSVCVYAAHCNSMLFCLPGKTSTINVLIFTAQEPSNSDTSNMFIWGIMSCEQQLTLRSKLEEVHRKLLHIYL